MREFRCINISFEEFICCASGVISGSDKWSDPGWNAIVLIPDNSGKVLVISALAYHMAGFKINFEPCYSNEKVNISFIICSSISLYFYCIFMSFLLFIKNTSLQNKYNNIHQSVTILFDTGHSYTL